MLYSMDCRSMSSGPTRKGVLSITVPPFSSNLGSTFTALAVGVYLVKVEQIPVDHAHIPGIETYEKVQQRFEV